jgi:hypothetical protein
MKLFGRAITFCFRRSRSPARTCFKQRCRAASQRSASPNQNALSLALRAPAARRRHSLALRRKRSVLVILASWTTPAALSQRQSIDPFWPECECHRESLWQVTPKSWEQILARPQTICRCELICLCRHNRCWLSMCQVHIVASGSDHCYSLCPIAHLLGSTQTLFCLFSKVGHGSTLPQMLATNLQRELMSLLSGPKPKSIG